MNSSSTSVRNFVFFFALISASVLILHDPHAFFLPGFPSFSKCYGIQTFQKQKTPHATDSASGHQSGIPMRPSQAMKM